MTRYFCKLWLIVYAAVHSRDIATRMTASRLKQALWRYTHRLRLGVLSRTAPVSRRWGTERGTPLDRYYIECFLEKNRGFVRGAVFEVKDSDYTLRFGTAVTRSEVIDIDPGNEKATIIADLADCDDLAGEQFDCFICTQTLQLIYDFKAAVANAYRLLKPGGTLLLTVPSVSRIVVHHGEQLDYWRFTLASCRRIFGEQFGDDQVEVTTYGNPMTGAAFLHGLAMEEIPAQKLDVHEAYFPVLCGVRATRRA